MDHELHLVGVIGERLQLRLRQLAGIPAVKLVMTMLWTCG